MRSEGVLKRVEKTSKGEGSEKWGMKRSEVT
jgi:stalled ribosome alternative rescue factor ArfA